MIYFDNAATTKVDKDVLNAYLDVLENHFANPSSPHIFAKDAESFFAKAKKQILRCLNFNDSFKVIMTSGATEANNIALIGYTLANLNRGNHIITSKYEHSSILNTLDYLKENYGVKVDYLDIDENGHIDIKQLDNFLNEKTILVTIMGVNNEIGAVNDIKEISKHVHKYKNANLHVDGSQAVTKVKLDYSYVDMLTVSSHKIYGLKGSGCLILRQNIQIHPIVFGGGQQDGLRSGTNDVANAVALAVAVRKGQQNLDVNFKHVKELFDRLYNYLISKSEQYEINSFPNNSPYILNFSFKNKKASVVTEALSMKGIMVSTSSACSTKKESGSLSVATLNKSKQIVENTLRVSFSKDSSLQEVEEFIKVLDEIIGGIRS